MTDTTPSKGDEVARLLLNRNEDRRLRAGHLWVYSNEVDKVRSPLKSFTPGQQALICDSEDHPIGLGYVNPHSLICARLVSRQWKRKLNAKLITARLQTALAWREKHYATPHYRWVFAEADGLPGLVLDRYGDVVVGQISTAGMELLREVIEQSVISVLAPAAMIWRNMSTIRDLEGIDRYDSVAFGEAPEFLQVNESGLKFEVPAQTGQKTGWFYDQAANRSLLKSFSAGTRVLDTFSYAGGWGIAAAVNGASEVTCVDQSQSAVDQVAVNAGLNNVQDKVTAIKSGAFEFMQEARQQRQEFDLIIVDPPAFIKKAKDKRNGLEAYRRINEMAMRLLSKDGLLFSCSCSFHLSSNELQKLIQQAARHLDRHVQIISLLQQSPDHPVHPAIPETRYLKGFIVRVIPTR
jgi:23S rRNA (cytosine1962-C5)-methyltransferase